MNVCGTTRLLIPGFLVGLAIATVAGNDRYGWIAAASTIAVLAVIPKVRGTNQVCAISPPSAPPSTCVEVERGDDEPADLTSR